MKRRDWTIIIFSILLAAGVAVTLIAYFSSVPLGEDERILKTTGATDNVSGESAIKANETTKSTADISYLPKLPDDVEEVIYKALKARDSGLVSWFDAKIKLTGRGLQRLQGSSWLDFESLDCYGWLLQKRSESRELEDYYPWPMPRIYFYPTALHQNYNLHNIYGSVMNFTGHVASPLKDYDLIFFPINIEARHWTFAAMDLRQKTLLYYDHQFDDGMPQLITIKKYISEESLIKLGKPFDWDGWRIENERSTPRQTNGHDCGVFLLLAMERLSRGAPLDYREAEMQFYRKRISYELITKALLPPIETSALRQRILEMGGDVGVGDEYSESDAGETSDDCDAAEDLDITLDIPEINNDEKRHASLKKKVISK